MVAAEQGALLLFGEDQVPRDQLVLCDVHLQLPRQEHLNTRVGVRLLSWASVYCRGSN